MVPGFESHEDDSDVVDSRSKPIILPPQRMVSHATPEKLSLHLSVTDICTHSVYNAYTALCVMSIRSKIIAWEVFTRILLLLS